MKALSGSSQAASAALLSILLAACSQAPQRQAQAADAKHEMSFFVSSSGSGKGGDLGGLAGADRICQSLAAAAGAGNRDWKAYLSASPSGSTPAVNARDRIGKGPWYNAKGVLIARNVDELHGNNNLNKQTALTERGQVVNGRGDTPNMHDILTGSGPDGRAFTSGPDMTCHNWTSSSDGAAMVGHHDRNGTGNDPVTAQSWNSAHLSAGCSQDALRKTGGNGLLYCFAAD